MNTGTPLVKLPALQKAWCCKYAILGALAGLGISIALAVMVKVDGERLLPPLQAIVGGTLVFSALGALYGTLAYGAFSAALLEGEGVIVRRGIWWRTAVMVPITRLQHIDINQGPLDRRWAMARLTLHTAGTHDKGTRIDGLPVEQAHALRSTLLPRQPLPHD